MPPIITLKTDLKSLKFGSDRLGGGSSGQPFIQTPIEDEFTPTSIKRYYNLNRTSLDFPIRGGSLDYNTISLDSTQAGVIDRNRIKKFIESEPRGGSFIKKQIGLQLSNPRIQTGERLFNLQTQPEFPSFLLNTQIYNNGNNTLTQVLLSGTGTHITRQGVSPIDTNAKYYQKFVSREQLLNAAQVIGVNRLLILNSMKMTIGAPIYFTSNNATQISKLGISTNKNYLFDYLNGPGSVYGIGTTTIRRYDDTRTASEKTQKQLDSIPKQIKEKLNFGPILTYDRIMQQKINTISDGYSTKNIQDFKQTTPGEKILDRESRYQFSGTDIINKEAYFLLENKDDPWAAGASINDMIKFGFECISNDDPTKSLFIQFRALLDGSITDNNAGSWNAFKYLGRGEDFYTYQGFSRSINFSFKLAAMSKEEMKPMYNKLNLLISQVYPDYSPTKKIMRGGIVRLTIGDYLYRVPGIIDSINVVIEQTTSWENQYNQNIGELPQVLSVAVSFKPIHNELMKRGTIEGTLNTQTNSTTKTLNIPSIIANNNDIIDKNENINPALIQSDISDELGD